MQCDYVLEELLDRRASFGGSAEFTQAWRRGAWDGAKVHLAVLTQEEHIQWLGRAQGGSPITNFDRIVRVTDVEEIEPIPLASVGRSMPRRHRDIVNRVGIIPPAGGLALVDALKELAPARAGLIDRLQQAPDLRLPRGRRGEIMSQERDGLGLLLDIAGLGRRALGSWVMPAAEVPFLAGMPETPALEDHLIQHDIDRFGSWAPLPTSNVAWRAFTDGRRRMFVMNANRTPVERTLGVDVVYWNEGEQSFVLVQYKKMKREDSGANGAKEIYRPDRNLPAELDRMRRVDAMCAQESRGGFRLLATACWLKICRPNSNVQNPTELIRGMYLSREYFEELLTSSSGPQGGRHLSYENVPKHLNNTLFVDLVSGGWIGSRGGASGEIEQLVRESLQTRHAVLVGVQTAPQADVTD